MSGKPIEVNKNYEEQYGFHDPEKFVFKAKKGLSKEVVEEISGRKEEPDWMRQFRLRALEVFLKKPLPAWADLSILSQIHFDDIYYYLKPMEKQGKTWEEVPADIKNTFDKLGIPEAERKFLAGVSAQYESEVVYHSIHEDLEKQGVIFLGMDDGLKKYPELVKKYFGTVIPLMYNKFAALNSATWSGGSFIYVPKGVKVAIPLQAYFRINAQNMGQFERTLVIADEGSSVHYVEGCTAPVYASDSLHSAVVELIALPHSHIRYTTIQNWSKNVYNLVTKRAIAHENSIVEWLDGNLGCLTGDAQLFLNPDGPIAIRDVKPGRKVYALDLNTLQPRGYEVTATRCTGIRPTYRLTTENYREVKATDNHPFLVLTRERFSNLTQLQWRPLRELRVGDLLGITRGVPDAGRPKQMDYTYPAVPGKGLKNRPILPKETTDDLMWFLGLYLGDGYIEKERTGRPRRVSLAVPERDRARVKLEKLIPELFQIGWKPKGLCVTINSAVVADWILSIGLTGRAREKRVPAWIHTLPLSQKLSFIEGYMDADGCVRKHKVDEQGKELGQIAFVSCHKELLEDLKLLMIQCGLNPLKISEYVKERRLWKGRLKEYRAYFLWLNIRDNLKAIRDKVVSNAGLEFVKVKSIEPLGEEPVYDIEVDGA
ncbi:MAG: Fe-S cluster assembly protein SufB, partial [Candidatus Omnitrophica bacterium]|nr:Fe-S cluster assembly protein SufB [Candidatus Omnitrophota bacterium]